MVVTIDGPAGAGKSSAARRLAVKLGFRFLDTGALYRAVALIAWRRQIDFSDEALLVQIAHEMSVELDDDTVRIDGQDVTQALRSQEITSLTRFAADNRGVRDELTRRQRLYAEGHDVVTEGRDQATVVFPDAECKIFLTAGEEVRARRRHQDLVHRGQRVDLLDVLSTQRQRDVRDVQREYGGLVKAADAIEVCTDDMSPEQVVDCLEAIVRNRQQACSAT